MKKSTSPSLVNFPFECKNFMTVDFCNRVQSATATLNSPLQSSSKILYSSFVIVWMNLSQSIKPERHPNKSMKKKRKP